ncbi:GNAT family N-acetyltransferase [Candidatus Nomurabacteria bacterium]|nr:GNAT family N-acetyltransferase [Candidatus Nomurabacteria bacterium]
MKTSEKKVEIFDFTDRNRQESARITQNFEWWSCKTREEKHMLTLSVDEIKSTLLMAVFSYENNEIIGAAGIFLPRTCDKSEPYLDGKKVVEIGTNFVLPDYRGNGIGESLIRERLKFAKEKNWVSVSISSNEVVQKIFRKVNGCLMEDHSCCEALRKTLCLRCNDRKENCKICPLFKDCSWVFF